MSHFTLPVFGPFSPDYLLLVQLSLCIYIPVCSDPVVLCAYWFLLVFELCPASSHFKPFINTAALPLVSGPVRPEVLIPGRSKQRKPSYKSICRLVLLDSYPQVFDVYRPSSLFFTPLLSSASMWLNLINLIKHRQILTIHKLGAEVAPSPLLPLYGDGREVRHGGAVTMEERNEPETWA